jgi:hypothetical protein
VRIPAALQDAMSMQAQAERERQARVILGDSEREVADSFNAAAKTYADNPTAFHLRAMNMLYEGLKRAVSDNHGIVFSRKAISRLRLTPPRGRPFKVTGPEEVATSGCPLLIHIARSP